MPIEVLANKANIAVADLKSWEAGESKASMAQLRRLADAMRRQVSLFWMPSPPESDNKRAEFRVIPGKDASERSPELRLAIRDIEYRQEVARELREDGIFSGADISVSASLDDSPATISEKIRRFLGISLLEQMHSRSESATLKMWRTAVESVGVLVFQIEDVQVEEARGFSLPDDVVPVIAINPKDSYYGRVFTLLHEFAHLLLDVGGLKGMPSRAWTSGFADRVEKFCDAVSANLLVPRGALRTAKEVIQHDTNNDWEAYEVRRLSRRFGASEWVVARALTEVGLMSRTNYITLRNGYKNRKAVAKAKPSGGPTYQTVMRSRLGEGYISIVWEAYQGNRISRQKTAEYLGVRHNHIESIVGVPQRRTGT